MIVMMNKEISDGTEVNFGIEDNGESIKKCP